MIAAPSILKTWEKFSEFPMETLTKLWFYTQGFQKKQRDVSLMKEHREQYGLAGNCFDLAIWLLDECRKDGIEAYPIGRHLLSEHAHAAVIALDEKGNRFFCDLGDQWLRPILIDRLSHDYSNEKLSGFFPGAQVQIQPNEEQIEIRYHRPNGKVSKQLFDPAPLDMDDFFQAAEYSQQLIKPNPLLECRVPYKTETAHWEFYNWESFLSTSEGLFTEPKRKGIEEWAEKIHQKTGYHREFLVDVLQQYKKIQDHF